MKAVLGFFKSRATSAPALLSASSTQPSTSEVIVSKVQEESRAGETQPVDGLGDLARARVLDDESAAANGAQLVKHQYANDNLLQGYGIYIPEPPAGLTKEEENKRVWVVFIHGGYWCDPQQLASTFIATRAVLLGHPSCARAASLIAGYASLNYRLSPHPSFRQDRAKTPAYEMRDAIHPDHINDILSALRDLQKWYGFGERYLLCGYGCGATLALQVAMGRRWMPSGPMEEFLSKEEKKEDAIPPMAILGIDGLYDIPLLELTNEALHHSFIQVAFGENPAESESASPACWTKYAESWKGGRYLMLAHSRQNKLLDWSQVEAMETCWKEKQEGWDDGKPGIELEVSELHGDHAQAGRKELGMAGSIQEAVLLMTKDYEAEM